MAQQVAPTPRHTVSDGGKTAIVNSFVFSFLATIIVGLRFYMRRVKRTGILVEDWLILAALILQWSYVVVVFLLAFDGGLGWPSDQLTPDTLVRSSKYSLAGQTNWPIANALIKVSICLTFIRIFITKPFRIAATTVYILSIGWSIATILVGWVICTPLSELWTKAPGGHCGNTTAAYVSLGVFDVLLDMAVFSLPLPMLYSLQVAKHAKVALVATFGLGLFTIVAGVMRLVAVIQIDYQINFDEAQVGDAYWCTIESSVGIIVACSMTLRPLLDRLLIVLKRYFGQLHGINSSRRTGGRKLPTKDLETTTDSAPFVRLHDDHQDLPLEGLQIPQKAFGDHTKRASLEHV